MVTQALEAQKGGSMKDKVAVIILNWNGAAMLKQFLPSVVACTNLPQVSIYVADNGSTDDSVSLVEQAFPAVKLILLEQNYGFAEGYNKAIQKVDAEYVVLLNSDVEVTKGWLEPLIAYLDANPQVAACQPKIKSWREKNYFEYAGACGGYLDRYGYPFCRGRLMSTLEEDKGQYDTIQSIFWASGAALVCRKAIYLELGGLDPRFFAHMEEIDLCWRMNARGHQLVVIPTSVVYHVGGATLNQANPKKTYLNFRNNLLMIYKNLPAESINKVLQMRLFLDYIAILFFLVKGELQHAKAVWKARKDFKKMKKEYTSSRQKNLACTVQSPLGVYPKSLVFQYYFKGKHKFSQLRNK